MPGKTGFVNVFFKLDEKNTNIRTELLAGLTTFLAVSYIIFVNPNILAQAGIPKPAAIAATIWATIAATTLMGLWANYPVAVAPGMGINAFFTYTVVLGFGLSWQTALGAVFISGVVFFILTLGGIRQAIINAVPMNIKLAIAVGIGAFIAFVGLHGAGIVAAHPATLVTIGPVASLTFSEMEGQAPLLALLGLVFTGLLMGRGVRGAILLGIIFTTILGMVFGASPAPAALSDIISFNVPSILGPAGTFGQLDILGALTYGVIGIIFSFTIVELFDNMGTLIGVTKKAKLMKPDGRIENLGRALTTDAIGTMGSAVMGTSTVVSYVESAAGVAEGGRTGLTALTVAALFLVTLLFAPLISLVPVFATAPALIVVGALMMSEAVNLKLDDITDAIPAFLTIIMMPLTYSIVNGFAFGFVSYTLLKIFSGKTHEVSWVMIAVSLAFVVNFYLRLH